MRILTCAIVEDSNLHRILLAKIIKKNPRLELKFSFSDSAEGLKEINTSNIDLLFLDIEMPIMSGLEFLARLKTKPQIIIISQNPKYAIDAFDYEVTDYLLKPFNKNRFEIAIQKVIGKAKQEKKDLSETKLIVKHNLKQVELNINNIQWVEALGDYVKVVTHERNYVVLSTLGAFLEKLGNKNFLRIHKSYLVNLKMVERYNHQYIEVKDKKLPLSRNKNLKIDQLLNCVE
jgi:DNA-binding LytR/AlgR family response regulator